MGDVFGLNETRRHSPHSSRRTLLWHLLSVLFCQNVQVSKTLNFNKNPSFLIVSRSLKWGREGGKESCANSGSLLPGMQDFAVLPLFSIACCSLYICVSDKRCTGDSSVIVKRTFRFSQLSLVRIFRKWIQSISTCQYAFPKLLSQRSCWCFVPNSHEPHATGGTTCYLE